MSGVIDEFGQWEHCNVCGGWTLIEDLLYAESKLGKWIESHRGNKVDICARCVDEDEWAQRTRCWLNTEKWVEEKLASGKYEVSTASDGTWGMRYVG